VFLFDSQLLINLLLLVMALKGFQKNAVQFFFGPGQSDFDKAGV
jgi:hypothetical protein